MSDKQPVHIHRYTEVKHLLSYLDTGGLGFPSPDKWDDENDKYYLDLYREFKKTKHLFCCCLTSAPETYHHWRIFGGKSIGVRISFKRDDLSSRLERAGAIIKPVEYLKLRDIDAHNLSPEDLPFIKRYGFRDEKEIRAIIIRRRSPRSHQHLHQAKIGADAISEITISPFCKEETFLEIKDTINKKKPPGVRLYKSSLIDNNKWKVYGRKILKCNIGGR